LIQSAYWYVNKTWKAEAYYKHINSKAVNCGSFAVFVCTRSEYQKHLYFIFKFLDLFCSWKTDFYFCQFERLWKLFFESFLVGSSRCWLIIIFRPYITFTIFGLLINIFVETHHNSQIQNVRIIDTIVHRYTKVSFLSLYLYFVFLHAFTFNVSEYINILFKSL